MNRDIKFRAWNGEAMWDRTLFDRNWYADNKCCRGAMPNDARTLKVMQFTGLKDKNGADIYEGDIIFYNGYGNYSIVWDGDSGCWDTDLIGPVHEAFLNTNLFELSESPKQRECEVIGNIHQNPDLLTKD